MNQTKNTQQLVNEAKTALAALTWAMANDKPRDPLSHIYGLAVNNLLEHTGWSIEQANRELQKLAA